MIQTKQTLNQLIKYFKNFNFQILDIYRYPCDADIKNFIQSYQRTILNSLAMIHLFEEKNNEILNQNELLISQMEDLKDQILEEQKNTHKIDLYYKKFIQNLRLQLIQKQDQCRCLTEKLQTMQAQLQNFQIELLQKEVFILSDIKQSQNQLNFQEQNIQRNSNQMLQHNDQQFFQNQNCLLILKNQLQNKLFSKISQLKIIYQQRIQYLSKQLSTQKQTTESLYQRLNKLQTKLKKLQEQKLIQSKTRTQLNDKNQTNFYYFQSNDPQYRSPEQLDFKSQETSLLKDILNCFEKEPQQKYFKKNSNFPYEIPSASINQKNQKQNINLSIYSKLPKTCQDKQTKMIMKLSGKNQFMDMSDNKSELQNTFSNQLSEKNQINNSPQFIHEFSLEKIQQQYSRMNLQKVQKDKIKVIEKQSQHFDPYYSFFILSAQCIKMNSKFFEYIAQVDVEQEWQEVIEKRIPLNEWGGYLETKILQKGKIPQCK